jgi:hypothetical protein
MMTTRRTLATDLKNAIASEDEGAMLITGHAHMEAMDQTAGALRIFIESWHGHLLDVTTRKSCRCLMCGTGRMMLEEFHG